MYRLLHDMLVVEGASFIAAPSCGLHLVQLGAEVIRFDQIGGGLDFRRWPLSPSGASFYWEGLNKGKKSIAVDLSSPEGRELVGELIGAPGADRGMFLTNFPASGFLSYERLRKRREDLILMRVMGRADGTQAVDYTVNSAVGIPMMTGPASLGDEPVNHVLPAWDLVTGAYAAFALLAAERHRRATGEGQEVRIPLSDMAIATLGHLGQIAETTVEGHDRKRYGNDLFGAFGRDFVTGDGRRVIIVAISPRQWTGLVTALGIEAEIQHIEAELGVSFAADEGLRFMHRDRLNAIAAAAIARRTYDELAESFSAKGVCWGPYQSLGEAVTAEPNPILTPVAHPSGFTYPTPGAAGSFGAGLREAPGRAPRLGEHTDEVLSEILGLSGGQIGDLHDRGVVAGAERGTSAPS